MREVGIIGTMDVTTWLVARAAQDLMWKPKVFIKTNEPPSPDLFMIEQFCEIKGDKFISVRQDYKESVSTYINVTEEARWGDAELAYLMDDVQTPDFVMHWLGNEDSKLSAFILTGSRQVHCVGSGCNLPGSTYWVEQMVVGPDDGARWAEGGRLHPWSAWQRDNLVSIREYHGQKPPLERLVPCTAPTFGGICHCFDTAQETGHFTAIGEMAEWLPVRTQRKKVYKQAQDFLSGI